MATPSYAGFTQPEEEIFYSTYEPTKEEIIEYAVKIGIDPEKEAHIIYLARQGLLHPLPENWKPCYSKQVKAYYYYDRITKKSQWEHPIDVLYRAKVIDARKALAVDRSDSTSFGDSGFRSLKSSYNKSVTAFSTNDQTQAKDPDCGGGSLTLANQQQKGNKTNQDAKKSEQLAGGVTNLAASSANDESDSNKENNSQDAAVGVVKHKSNVDSAIAFTKKLSFNMDTGGHEVNNDVKEPIKMTNDGKMSSSLYGGFTITGTGSQFLKSNKKLEFGSLDLGRKPESEMKGILRDTSLSYVRSKSTPNDDSGNDERKSVRFDIDIDTVRSTNEMKAGTDTDATLGQKGDDGVEEDDDDDDDDDDGDDDDEEADANVDYKVGVDERLADHKKEEDVCEEGLKQTSSESSEPGSEVLTGVGVTIAKEGKPISAAASTPRAISNDLSDDPDLDSLRFLRHSIDQERERYKAKLEEELRSLAQQEESKIRIELTKERSRYEELLTKERQRLKEQHQQNIDEIKEFYQAKLNELKTDYEEENNKEYTVYQETLQEEFDRRVKEVTNTHKVTMANLQKNHDEIVEELERDLKMEEELLKKEHSTNLSEIKIKLTHELEMERQRMRETGEDRLYEKVRCEKRLLEDKYKCLKEKYTRLKTDVRISLERRKKRREQQQQQQQHSLRSNSYETDDRTNSKPLPSYSYEIGKGTSVSSTTAKPMMMSEKTLLSHPSGAGASKRMLTTGDGYEVESKHNVLHSNGPAGSVESRKSAFLLNHTNNNHNNNTTLKHQVDDSSQSEARYPKHYFQVKNIFGNIQHEDNFSSDSEFQKISCDNGQGVENSCSSSFTGAATAAARPKRKIFTKTKSSSTSKLNSTAKHEREVGTKANTPVENLRIQLKKLEELEDQIPDCNLDAPYHLRYPFVNNITNVDNTSKPTSANACMHGETGDVVSTTTDRSELEFFKHRILLERDSVMRAKESLRAQKNVFKSKQRDIAVKHAIKNKQTVDQIFHEEKELTEMEVSLHRTRALLGEKVIRLRHLENSLQTLSEKEHPIRSGPRDMPLQKQKETLSDLSSYSSSGFSSTDVPTTEHYGRLQTRGPARNAECTDTIMCLKHLHGEIQEIWSLLNPTSGGLPVMRFAEMDFLNNTATVQYNPVSGKQCCDVVLPQTTTTSTFNQTPVAIYAAGPQPSSNYSQNQHHYTISLLEKTRDLKNWLRQAKNEHEVLKKQTHGNSETGVSNIHI
ncbi:centrosomal protein of 164 kDa [Anopheles maculipalpis]|uniref:centrosomal protein of 164 kDa n=1 Tax=Anopheles maculipalpis TaxID=1496333 RepID=UPI002158D04A|nr:centrosomal protein of 164 kDa [Anopheles maculipalpis]